MHRPVSFLRRLQILVAVSFVAVVALAAAAVALSSWQIEEGRRATLVAQVQSAHSIVMGYHALAKAGRLPAEQAQAAAVAALRPARYGSNDYYYGSTRWRA